MEEATNICCESC